MLTFRELTYVVTVVKEGGFSNAAKKLYISQPSLSQYVKKIERALGFQLFERVGNSVRLTAMGREYVAFAEEVLNRRDSFLHAADDFAKLRKGTLSVGVSTYRSAFYIPKILPGFQKKYPGISITLFEKPAPNIEEAVAEGVLDLALSNLPVYIPRLKTIPLIDERVLLALPPEHHLRTTILYEEGRDFPSIDLRLAANEQFIMMPPTFRLRMIAEHICVDNGFRPNISLVTANHATAQHLTAQGFGLSFASETIMLKQTDAPVPIYTTFRERDYIWPIAALCPEKGYTSDAARAFITHARAVLRNEASLAN